MSTLNTREAAKVMKIHENSVLKLIDNGEIPAAKVGRAWVMMERDVLQYVENQIVRQTAQRMRSPTKAGRQATSRAISNNA